MEGHGKEESGVSLGFLAEAELSGEREWEEGRALGGNDVQCSMLGLECLWGIHLQVSSRLRDIYWFENSSDRCGLEAYVRDST